MCDFGILKVNCAQAFVVRAANVTAFLISPDGTNGTIIVVEIRNTNVLQK